MMDNRELLDRIKTSYNMALQCQDVAFFRLLSQYVSFVYSIYDMDKADENNRKNVQKKMIQIESSAKKDMYKVFGSIQSELNKDGISLTSVLAIFGRKRQTLELIEIDRAIDDANRYYRKRSTDPSTMYPLKFKAPRSYHDFLREEEAYKVDKKRSIWWIWDQLKEIPKLSVESPTINKGFLVYEIVFVAKEHRFLNRNIYNYNHPNYDEVTDTYKEYLGILHNALVLGNIPFKGTKYKISLRHSKPTTSL
jgi:hypothetical protein